MLGAWWPACPIVLVHSVQTERALGDDLHTLHPRTQWGQEVKAPRGPPPPGRAHRYMSSCEWAVLGVQERDPHTWGGQMAPLIDAPGGAEVCALKGPLSQAGDGSRSVLQEALWCLGAGLGASCPARDNQQPCGVGGA